MAGAAAKRLMEIFPDAHPTQLGWGERGLAFNFAPGCTVVFHVDEDLLTLEHIFWEQRISLGHAAKLIQGLADAAAAFASRKGKLL
jgi:hypothetical protein